jgi:hypothetical protein
MSVIDGIVVPESLLKQIRKMTEAEGISVEQFASSAIAEKASAWLTVDYLKERGKNASQKRFLEILSRVPDIEPDPEDRLD